MRIEFEAAGPPLRYSIESNYLVLAEMLALSLGEPSMAGRVVLKTSVGQHLAEETATGNNLL